MLGIDVSKDTLACALFNRSTEQFVWQKSVPNSAQGVQQLLDLTDASVPWVMEPTGRYSLFVAKQAREAGRGVLLAPSGKARAYLKSISERAKTDRLDGYGLALFGASRPACKPLAPYPIKSDSVEHLDQLLSARSGLVAALFYVIAGLGWVLPAMPLVAWMVRPDRSSSR